MLSKGLFAAAILLAASSASVQAQGLTDDEILQRFEIQRTAVDRLFAGGWAMQVRTRDQLVTMYLKRMRLLQGPTHETDKIVR